MSTARVPSSTIRAARDSLPVSLAGHCEEREYIAFLQRLDVTEAYRRMRRRWRREFVERWPRLEDWFAAPLRERIGRLPGERQKTASFPIAYRAHSYLYYLALTDRVKLDYDFLLAIGDLAVDDVARPLRIDFGLPHLKAEAIRLGYSPLSSNQSFKWAVHRIALHSGIRNADGFRSPHIDGILEAIKRFGSRRYLRSLLHPHQDFQKSLAQSWHANIHKLQVVLHHRGHDVPLPVKTFRLIPVYRARHPSLQAAVDRWLAIRRATWQKTTLEHVEVSLRHFLQHLEATSPRLSRFANLTQDHAASFLADLANTARPRTGRPLAISARRARVSAVADFFRDATAWGWPDVPERPLFDLKSLPRIPSRIPRFIPAPDLDRVMIASRELKCVFQRAALLTARWSGARRGEICRLTLDCLDQYPDGTARLRIPAGKTSRERLVPLHDEAAAALKELIVLRSSAKERPQFDERTRSPVRFIFLRRGQRISAWYLFDVGLRTACQAAGLVDAAGRTTITAHRFRHTVGTQLAERGAKLHTIMSVLGHESPHMSMVYARISDAEVLRDYRRVLGPGALIAGRGAEAVRAGQLGAQAVNWLKSNFLKTELELGHCLRLPSEGPCECDLYLTCAKFVTTPAYAPRLRERHQLELALAEDARKREWPREIQRHCGIAKRIESLLADLGQPMQPKPMADSTSS